MAIRRLESDVSLGASAAQGSTVEVLLGRGLDRISFGSSRADLVAAFGEPDRAFALTVWEDDDPREELEYWPLRTSFRLYDGDRLGWIETESDRVRLLGASVIGQNVETVARALEIAGYGDPEIDDYGSSFCYFWPDVWLELQVSYGRVSRLKLGVPFADDEEYAWPVG